MSANGTRPTDHVITVVDDPVQASEQSSPLLPSSIGRYLILGTLGVGGMGMVYSAYDPRLDRKVALKLLRSGSHGGPASSLGRARLLREAQALGKLSHPNVVTVHDVETHEGRVYISMEHVDGSSLKEWIQQQERSPKEILDVYRRAGRGLAAAHKAGIVHRDFKPANVLIGNDGSVRVADFGLAKTAGESTADHQLPTTLSDLSSEQDPLLGEIKSGTDLTLTGAGKLVGTPAYMAPEQFLGLEATPQADQFSFCVALFEALHGYLPYRGKDHQEHIAALLEGTIMGPPPTIEARPVPRWLDKALLPGLHPQPKARYADIPALLAALSSNPVRRRRRLVWAGAGSVVVVAALVGALNTREVNRCGGALDKIEHAWNPQRRAKALEAFRATGKVYAEENWTMVDQRLDAYSLKWAAAFEEICASTQRGEQSSTLLDLRMACLDKKLTHLGELTALLTEADSALVRESPVAVAALPAVDDCRKELLTGTSSPAPSDPSSRASIRSVEKLLARYRALESSSNFAEARHAAEQANQEATSLAYAPLMATAKVIYGRALREVGEHELAAAQQLQAIDLAVDASSFADEHDAWSELYYLYATRLDRRDAAQGVGLAADASLRRLGDDPARRGRLQRRRAINHQILDEIDDAIRFNSEALSIYRRSSRFDTVLPGVLKGQAILLARNQRVDEARENITEAIELTIRTRGSRHPDVAKAYQTLANIEFMSGNFQAASTANGAALPILEDVYGRRSLEFARVTGTRAMIQVSLKSHGEAIPNFRTAIEIYRQVSGPRHSRLAAPLNNLGIALLAQGKRAEAREVFLEALDIHGTTLSPTHWNITPIHAKLCELEMAEDRLKQALRHCRLALAGTDADTHTQDTASTNLQAEVRTAIASILHLDPKLAEADGGLPRLQKALSSPPDP